MNDNPFYRLAPFIQEYIYRERWEELRQVQVDSIRAILDTSHHVLIATGTASGKTEAAFLPILTDLHDNPSATIGVMYIGPLKALINDQFERLQGLLEETHIPVQSWHGDVSQSKKERFVKQAQGVLQITPESLEAMLINRHQDLGRLFGDLRFVIIDEVHAFINSDRGRQIICQLQRLARYQAHPPRRIGLSATLGEPEKAMRWLTGSTQISVDLIKDSAGGRSVELGMEYFIELPDEYDRLFEEAEGTSDVEKIEALEELAEATHELYIHMYSMVRRQKKTLVFANSRADVEQVTANLRQLAEKDGRLDDTFHAHHGSISPILREAAEEAMREPDRPACTAATITMELGIDIGQLDQVLQLDAPFTVSSFVQRLGRSGRRNTPSRMFFYNREELPEPDAPIGKQIPWGFLQTIAIAQLYIEDKWVEPPEIPQFPLSLLYHQTMSTVKAHTELTPPELAGRILTLAPFQHVTQDIFRDLLRHLIAIDHLEQTEIGGLIIGLTGERVVNNYHFFATFEDDTAYQVREKSREIGTIQSAPIEGDVIGLAGYAWKVLQVDLEKRYIEVERAKGKVPAHWTGGWGIMHPRILNRIYQILNEDTDYGYLQDRAISRLQEVRRLARSTGLSNKRILSLGGNHFMILPWCGTREFETLSLLIEQAAGPVKITKDGRSPYYMELVFTNDSPRELAHALRNILKRPLSANQLIKDLNTHSLMLNKYDRFVPEALLRKAYEVDYLDMDGALNGLQEVIGEDSL